MDTQFFTTVVRLQFPWPWLVYSSHRNCYSHVTTYLYVSPLSEAPNEIIFPMLVFQRDAHVRLNLADTVNIHVAGSCSHETILLSNSCCLLKFRKMRCLPHIFLGNPHNTSSSNVQFLWTFPEPLTFPRTVTEAPREERRRWGTRRLGWGERRRGTGRGWERNRKPSLPLIPSSAAVSPCVWPNKWLPPTGTSVFAAAGLRRGAPDTAAPCRVWV